MGLCRKDLVTTVPSKLSSRPFNQSSSPFSLLHLQWLNGCCNSRTSISLHDLWPISGEFYLFTYFGLYLNVKIWSQARRSFIMITQWTLCDVVIILLSFHHYV